MKKYWEINKRDLCIFPVPVEDKPAGIKIQFKPSTYWKKKHPTEEPIITTNIIKGQQKYRLPAYFNKNTIEILDF